MDASFSAARQLPALVSPRWRSPQAWRALQGPRFRLGGFLHPEAAQRLADTTASLAFSRLEFGVVFGAWAKPTTELGPFYALFSGPVFRALAEARLGTPLPSDTILNAWALSAGDHMTPHRDSRHYAGTFSVGLSAGWSADRGGAIAFGPGDAQGIAVRERWYPRLGDLLLFRPSPTSWHTVEPVRRGPRHSLTGWWVDRSRPDRWESP